MNNLPYNGNYPPGMKESDIPGIDNEDEPPTSEMDQWYIDAEDYMRAPTYEVYMKRDSRKPELITDPLAKKINDDLHKYYKDGIDPQVAVDMIENTYIEQCVKEWEAKR